MSEENPRHRKELAHKVLQRVLSDLQRVGGAEIMDAWELHDPAPEKGHIAPTLHGPARLHVSVYFERSHHTPDRVKRISFKRMGWRSGDRGRNYVWKEDLTWNVDKAVAFVKECIERDADEKRWAKENAERNARDKAFTADLLSRLRAIVPDYNPEPDEHSTDRVNVTIGDRDYILHFQADGERCSLSTRPHNAFHLQCDPEHLAGLLRALGALHEAAVYEKPEEKS